VTSATGRAPVAGGGRLVAVVTESAATHGERPLTGRAVRDRKVRVDETHAIDLAQLRRRGLLTGSNGARISWTTPARPGMWTESSLSLVRNPGGGPRAFVFVSRRQSVNGPVGAGSSCVVALTITRPHLGGWRWWFACPLPLPEGDGLCGRRVRVLYLRPGDQQPGCRLCLRLTYASRQHHRHGFYETYARPLAVISRLTADLCSRSPRRRFRALRRCDPEFALEMFGALGPASRRLRPIERGTRGVGSNQGASGNGPRVPA